MTHIAKNHPVRFLIESAASGRKLTAGDLKLLANADLPTGEALTEYGSAVESAARRVAKLGAIGNTKDARDLAEQEWARIADLMTDDQAAINTTAAEGDTTVTDMVADLFTN